MAHVIVGNVGRVEYPTTPTGKSFMRFTVAETEGYGDTKKTTWYSCRSWKVNHDLAIGQQVTVFGMPSENEVNGKVYKNLEVTRLDIMTDTESPIKEAKKKDNFKKQPISVPKDKSQNPFESWETNKVSDDIPF